MQQLSWKRLSKLVGYTVGLFLLFIGLWMGIWYFTSTYSGIYKIEQLKSFPTEYKNLQTQYTDLYTYYKTLPLLEKFDWSDISATEPTVIDLPAMTWYKTRDGGKSLQGFLIPMDKALGYIYENEKILTGFILRLVEEKSYLSLGLYSLDLTKDKPLFIDLVMNTFGSYRESALDGGAFIKMNFMDLLYTHNDNEKYGKDCLQIINGDTFAGPIPSYLVAKDCRLFIFEARKERKISSPYSAMYLQLTPWGRGDSLKSVRISIQKMK